MHAFYDATVELGVADQVTAFTASDFGRTLTSQRQRLGPRLGLASISSSAAPCTAAAIYGTPPAIANNGPDDVGQGRLLPTISVDQFAATLAAWFGVGTSDLPLVVPNIGNYSVRDIGFYN